MGVRETYKGMSSIEGRDPPFAVTSVTEIVSAYPSRPSVVTDPVTDRRRSVTPLQGPRPPPPPSRLGGEPAGPPPGPTAGPPRTAGPLPCRSGRVSTGPSGRRGGPGGRTSSRSLHGDGLG